MIPASNDRWINASSGKLLAQHGITCGRTLVERGLSTLHANHMREAEIHGTPAGRARSDLNEKIRQGENRSRKAVWQIRESALPLLREWIAAEKKWVSLNNYERVTELGLTNGYATLDFAAAGIYRELSAPLHQQGTPDTLIAYVIEKKGLRRGFSEQGRPVWQIRNDKVKLLKDYIVAEKHDAANPQWISSHNHQLLAKLGLRATTPVLDQVLKGYYEQQIALHQNEDGQILPQQLAQIERNLRPVKTPAGNDAWEINAKFVSRLKSEMEPQLRRKEPEWLSPTSQRWKAVGVRGRGETITRGMETLRERAIAERISAGMSEQEAGADVAAHVVKEGVGQDGRVLLKANLEQSHALREIIEAMPHHDSYMARVPKMQ